MPQTPPVHSPTAEGGAQGVSHAPQWASSSARSEHVPLQQSIPTWQACFGVQPGTHCVVATSQMVPGGHGSSTSQPTHVWVGRSHVGGGEPPLSPNWQSASSVHPGTHSFAAVQYAPLGHTSLEGRHCTHTALGTSQSGPFGDPAQSASSLHSAVLPPVPPVLPPEPPMP